MSADDVITPVLRYALELCNARERGGRGIAKNEVSGCIFDCSCWHDEYTQAILSKYPRCNVTFVTAQDMSTSGFSVVLCMGDGGSAGGGGGGARRRTPMEEFVRLFLNGEALQRMFACVCNNSNRDVQNKISKIISSVVRTTLCIRLTPIGLAPFRNDITMLLPYSMMDKGQLDFLGGILDQATFAVGASAAGNPIRAMGIGNEVIVVTMMDGVRIWSDTPSPEDMPLSHRHATAAQVRGPKEQILLFSGMAREERIQKAREEGSRAIRGKPLAGGVNWQIDTLDVLKAFVVCVFRSTQFTENEMRRGICDIVVQMVMHDVGLTQNTVDTIAEFINGIEESASAV